MYNSDLVVTGALASLGRVKGFAPILRTALTYPLTNRFRTGVTMAMFTLVVFTLVIGGTVTTAFTEAFNDVGLFGGGFDIRASTVQVNPIPDLEAAIAAEPRPQQVRLRRHRRAEPGADPGAPGRHNRYARELPSAGD